MNLDDRLKQHFANDFSLLCEKNWEKKTYAAFAKSAAKKEQFAHLPVDMLLFSLDICHEVELETDIFDLLNYNGCKEYTNYIFSNLPCILEKIQHIELKNQHILSLCEFINKRFWNQNNFIESIKIANFLLELKREFVRNVFKYNLKQTFRRIRSDIRKPSSDELRGLIEFTEGLKYRSPDFREALEHVKRQYKCTYSVKKLTVIIKKVFPRIKKDPYDLYEYTSESLFHYLKWNTTNLGNYVNDNYEKGLIRLIRAIENGKLTEEEIPYGKHLLAALTNVYFETHSSIPQDKDDIVYRLYSKEKIFQQVIKSFARFVPEVLSELFYQSFIRLEKNLMDQIY